MKSQRFQDVLWTPGQPIEPGAPRMSPDELSRRLLHLEKIIDDPKTDLVDMSELGRKLEQSWHPDFNTLFDELGRLPGSANRIAWGIVHTGNIISNAGSGDWTCTAVAAGECNLSWNPHFPKAPVFVAISHQGNGGAVAINGVVSTTGVTGVRHFLTSTGALSAGNFGFIALG